LIGGMIASLGLILFCQLVGEAIARGLALPVPGPVLGMALMFVVLIARDCVGAAAPGFLKSGEVEATGKNLLAHLSLLFIPAGVGVVRNLDVLAANGVALAAALIGSTVLALLASVATFRLVSRLTGGG
jgi:putative effector of murein hydrolase LrgA (UPF0299 family)